MEKSEDLSVGVIVLGLGTHFLFGILLDVLEPVNINLVITTKHTNIPQQAYSFSLRTA